LAIALVSSHAAVAESLAELLQKGIYTQETVGDFDAAIKIYKQIITEATGSRSYAAQAQYRLGVCYLKKGLNIAAEETFQKLIKEFPEEKELVAKAREHVPDDLKILPTPWEDGEVLHLAMKLPTGLELGTVIWSVGLAEVGGRRVWRIQNRQHAMTGRGLEAISRVDADTETLRPITSFFRHSLLGEAEGKYEAKQANIKIKGKDTIQTVELNGPAYDNEQAIYLMRRLPLEVGYRTIIPICSLFGGGLVNIGLEVTNRETVEVEAGKFECFKAELDIVGQIFWFSTDPHRYLVKFAAGGVVAELTKIARRDPYAPNEYRDDELGFSLEAPKGWLFYEYDPQDRPSSTSVHLLDPEATATTILWAEKLEPGKMAYGGDIRKHAEEKITTRKKQLKDYTVRPDSWTERTVGGRPALGFVADFVLMKKEMVEYFTFVGGPSLDAFFHSKVERDKADDFRKKFDEIVSRYIVR
jgi:tetratricopeptide (TPR) repeat protein